MQSVFVGIGSNIDREDNINGGVKALQGSYGALILSSVYESIPYGFDGENFYNLVVGFSTDQNPEAIAARLREIEYEFGRAQKLSKYSSRALDIDLLLFGDMILEDDNIRIPREDLLKYSFVLCPMAEIVPEQLHPIENKTYIELWQEYQKPRNDLWKIDFNWDLNE